MLSPSRAAHHSEDLSLAYKPLSEWGPAASRQRRRKSISIFQHLPDPSTSAVLRSITLTQEDMPNHVARIYFEGGNTFNMPLACPRAAPPAAASLVLPREFEDLAKNCDTADMWTTAQWRTCALLRAFCFPLAILYEQRLRRVTVAAVRQALVGNDHACMRSARARALARSLKFATSACGTLAWLDVLCCDDDDRAALNAGMPRLPLVLMCAGTGDFFDPFQLPSRDALAVFVGHSMFGSGWLMFAAHLNALLRQVRREPLDASDWLAMARLVDYVDILNLVRPRPPPWLRSRARHRAHASAPCRPALALGAPCLSLASPWTLLSCPPPTTRCWRSCAPCARPQTPSRPPSPAPAPQPPPWRATAATAPCRWLGRTTCRHP